MDRQGAQRLDRRAVLAGAVGIGLGFAGCVGGASGGGDANGGSGPSTASGSGGSDDGQALASHPAGRSIGAQPRLGPDPASASAVIVAFEDPSCPRCAAFERETVPKIRSQLVDTGEGTFVARSFPVVYEWGKPATQALESTFVRDEAAFWSLANFYFENQSRFDVENVLPETESFLAAETDLDAAGVVADAGDARHDAAVQADLAAGRDAGASATPTVFLFRDGQYVTKAAGSVSYDLIASALGR